MRIFPIGIIPNRKTMARRLKKGEKRQIIDVKQSSLPWLPVQKRGLFRLHDLITQGLTLHSNPFESHGLNVALHNVEKFWEIFYNQWRIFSF